MRARWVASQPVATARWLGGRSLTALFWRYTVSSGVALAVSELTLVICYGTGFVGAGVAAVIAFFAGAIPNYALNRSWVWRRSGPVPVLREFVPYVLISLTALLLGVLGASVAASIAPGGHRARVVFVAAGFLAVNGMLFVAKFIAYHAFLFRAPDMTGSGVGVVSPRAPEMSETDIH